MRNALSILFLVVVGVSELRAEPLGLPSVPIPHNNPQTPAKIKLGKRLFNDVRFSADGKVSCSTCHLQAKAFTDGKRVSTGFHGLMGTRNAPTVINSAYMTSLFWDGREPDLEGQSKQPFINPVEGGLPNHQPILEVIRKDREYLESFKSVFGRQPGNITIDDVAKAIASFERTRISGDSPFDRYYFAGDKKALSAQQVRGFKVYTGQGRCVSCHRIEQTQALFTDNRFHNTGMGFERISGKEAQTAAALLASRQGGASVDVTVLSDANISELGRFAVTGNVTQTGAFKTPTLRNVALTAPYMHNGDLKTLADVVSFYNNGGRVQANGPSSSFQSGGMRPLDLSQQQQDDLVAFLKALTSPGIAQQVVSTTAGEQQP